MVKMFLEIKKSHLNPRMEDESCTPKIININININNYIDFIPIYKIYICANDS